MSHTPIDTFPHTPKSFVREINTAARTLMAVAAPLAALPAPDPGFDGLVYEAIGGAASAVHVAERLHQPLDVVLDALERLAFAKRVRVYRPLEARSVGPLLVVCL